MKNNKLRWACRRGMLELDVLLGNFLDNAYSELPNEQKEWFVELLGYSDPQLFAWLLGQEEAKDQRLAAIIDAIRKHAKSRI